MEINSELIICVQLKLLCRARARTRSVLIISPSVCISMHGISVSPGKRMLHALWHYVRQKRGGALVLERFTVTFSLSRVDDQPAPFCEKTRVHRKEMILNCRIQVAVESLAWLVRADWLIAVSLPNLGDTFIPDWRVVYWPQSADSYRSPLFVCFLFCFLIFVVVVVAPAVGSCGRRN